jgi:hypothetical protein
MFPRLLAFLLVFAWVDLAALDLLEDLKGALGSGAYTQSSKFHARGSSRNADLTNNIVESAVSVRAGDTLFVWPESSLSQPDSLSSFHKVLDLQKLHRVYLI